jgi:catechol 2,3-dioxygenase-like lactoylglutathione lyase family enzyme
MTAEFAGIHHLALHTRDLDRTLDFYSSVIGLDTSDVADSPRGRHAYVHLEVIDSGRRGLHFWENREHDLPDTEANLSSFSSGPGLLAHVALYLPSAQAVTDLQERLDAGGIDTREFPELGTFAFPDPNGIMVEIVRGRP